MSRQCQDKVTSPLSLGTESWVLTQSTAGGEISEISPAVGSQCAHATGECFVLLPLTGLSRLP